MSAKNREAKISVALETTSRQGGLALGVGEDLVEALAFDAAQRAATQVVARLDELLRRHQMRPGDVDELYVSAGPGSFTGTRVGVTVARTMSQATGAQCVSVPTVQAVAERVRDRADMRHLAVVLDARQGRIFVALFTRGADGELDVVEPGFLTPPQEFLERAPRPLHVTGEGLGYHKLEGEGVIALPQEAWLATSESVWQVGRRLARAGQFVDYLHLLPIYTGKPEAVRKWDELHGPEGGRNDYRKK